ncbi:MAG: 4Fe-4S cluster-binding domain-containing protein [Candidatus Njordarchaeia archaeon]
MKYNTRIYEIILSFIDYPSPDDHAIVVYFCGCSHGCQGCHNPLLQNYEIGEEYTIDKLIKKINSLNKINPTNKLVFSGGDPLYSRNRHFVEKFTQNFYKKFDICIYTGYIVEEIILMNLDLKFKFLKTGRYKEQFAQPSRKTDEEFVLASTNQKIFDSNYKLLSNNGVLKFERE